MSARQSSISLEYAQVKITANVSLSSQTVELAFMSSSTAEPGSSDWVAATWLGAAGKTRNAGVLVGPGQKVLAEGTYFVWFRVTDTPEIPAKYAGELMIT